MNQPAPPSTLTLATWNVEWATPRNHAPITERIAAMNADILVVTEGDTGVLPAGGTHLDGGTDWGYTNTKPDWRKVMLWSRHPMRAIEGEGPAKVPGRFTMAQVNTPVGDVTVIGVCIPWRDAHVRTGRRDAEPWDEHKAYLDHLGTVIRRHRDQRLVVMGDFNQRFPRTRAPQEVFDAINAALEGLTVVTVGQLPGLTRQDVDHIAVSDHFEPQQVWGIDRHDDSGRLLSDHDAVLAYGRRAM